MTAMWCRKNKSLNDNLKSLSSIVMAIRTFKDGKRISHENDNFKVIIVDSYGHETPLHSIEVDSEKQKIYINKE